MTTKARRCRRNRPLQQRLHTRYRMGARNQYRFRVRVVPVPVHAMPKQGPSIQTWCARLHRCIGDRRESPVRRTSPTRVERPTPRATRQPSSQRGSARVVRQALKTRPCSVVARGGCKVRDRSGDDSNKNPGHVSKARPHAANAGADNTPPTYKKQPKADTAATSTRPHHAQKP